LSNVVLSFALVERTSRIRLLKKSASRIWLTTRRKKKPPSRRSVKNT